MQELFEFGGRSARLSDCRRYRYSLGREWSSGTGTVCFVMLNPSTADALEDDATVRRCMGFAKLWGYKRLEIRNLFAWRATDPKELLTAPDPIGPENDAELQLAKAADQIIVAWGTHGSLKGRDRAVLKILADVPVYCLGRSQAGHPLHPLRLRADTERTLFAARESLGGLL